MARLMKVTGKIIKSMEKANKYGMMEVHMKVIISMIKNMVFRKNTMNNVLSINNNENNGVITFFSSQYSCFHQWGGNFECKHQCFYSNIFQIKDNTISKVQEQKLSLTNEIFSTLDVNSLERD